jgi:superkiller protein 3
MNLAAIYFKQGKYENALKLYKSVSDKDPKNLDALTNLGKVQSALKQFAEAEASFNKALAQKPDDKDLQKELSKLYFRKNDYANVIKTTQQIHTAGGGDDETWYMLGRAYSKTDKSADAITALNKSVQLDPKQYGALFELGQIYLSQEKYGDAATSFRAAMKANPKKHLAAFNYAIAKESMAPEDTKTNLVAWEEFVRLFKNDPLAKTNIATAEAHIKEMKDALAAKGN